jgi:hypothetical protein
MDQKPEEEVKEVEQTEESSASKKDIFAILSLIMGAVGFTGSCCIPLCGCPVALAGVVLGIVGLQSTKKSLAIVGIALNGFTIVFAIGWQILGVALRARYFNFR